jgi:DNA-binding PadR family transcriptional regulator
MPSERRSPLGFLLLALLTPGPQNAYRMHRFLLDTDKASVVNIGSRNSVYQSLSALERDGLISVHSQGERDSTLYALTDAGQDALASWLAETISTPREEYPAFPAALATASLLTPQQLADYLDRRRAHLARQLARPTPEQVMKTAGIDRIFVLEDEYRRSRLTAEHEWLTQIIDDLTSGAFTWDPVPSPSQAKPPNAASSTG